MRDIERLPGDGLKAIMTEREFKRTRSFWHGDTQYRISGAIAKRDGSILVFSRPVEPSS